MKQAPTAYRAYMLRIWIMDNDGCPQWRLSLEDVRGDTIIQFESMTDFFVFLLGAMDTGMAQATADDDRLT